MPAGSGPSSPLQPHPPPQNMPPDLAQERVSLKEFQQFRAMWGQLRLLSGACVRRGALGCRLRATSLACHATLSPINCCPNAPRSRPGVPLEHQRPHGAERVYVDGAARDGHPAQPQAGVLRGCCAAHAVLRCA